MSVRQTGLSRWEKLVGGAGGISSDPGVTGERFMASKRRLMLLLLLLPLLPLLGVGWSGKGSEGELMEVAVVAASWSSCLLFICSMTDLSSASCSWCEASSSSVS